MPEKCSANRFWRLILVLNEERDFAGWLSQTAFFAEERGLNEKAIRKEICEAIGNW